ncbi:hypothetical protein L596_022337 [Steinernema carpocapsae]|uniref:HCNGP-like protein n=1 Tax=Steinernema carpocapsae TaxID=34508 RepID=A0A4V6A066_STECR|nr:hypothetical protein L596_022337 [Steinernema carpocapsae]
MAQLGGLVAYGSDSDDGEVEESPPAQGVSFQISSSSSHSVASHCRFQSQSKTSKEKESFKERARRRNSEHFTDSEEDEESGGSGDQKRSRTTTASPALVHPAIKRLAIPQTTSQVSLVSYGGDEEDDFEKEDIRLSKEELVSPTRSATATAEPRPPRGHDDGDKDESPEIIEADIDNFEASKTAWKQENSSTPQSVGSTEDETLEERMERENAVRMPSPPLEACSPTLEAHFHKLFEKKFNGRVDPNRQIQERQDFKNPSIYEKVIEYCDLDEIGSNFPKCVYDPHIFDADGPEKGQGFYDRIRDKQNQADRSQLKATSGSRKH